MQSDGKQISEEISRRIRRQVESGRFAAPEDVLECALEILEDEETYGFTDSEIAAIRKINLQRMAALDQGEALPGEATFDALEEKATPPNT